MAITGADKIFVDVNDEINFVVEKILSAERERVILVVPQNAIIISSLVSMKILAKQLAKSKKQLVLVTEDAFGLGLAERSGLVAINKVSNISPEMWEAAQIAKETLKTKMDDTKKLLLTDRGAIKPEKAREVELPAAAAEPEQPEIAEEAEVPAESAPEEAVAETEPEVATEQVAEDEVVAEEEEVKGAINRPRREAKVVHLAGFEILAGGDITQLDANKDAIIDGSEEETYMEAEPASSKKASKSKPTGGFTGRDWTNYTNDKAGSFSLSSLLPFKRQPQVVPGERRPIMPGEAKGNRDKRRIAIIAAVVVLFLIFGAGYVLAFQLNNVEVKISLQTQQVPVQQQISADTALTAIDKDKLVIPAKLISNTDLSISASDKATGTGQSGDKAAGLIEIWNETNKDVTITSGTVAENTTTNLKYDIQGDVTVPAAKNGSGPVNCSSDPTCTIGIAENVHVVAQSFGEDYNITGSGAKVDFTIGNYAISDIKGKRFGGSEVITGGTTTTFTAVSQDDFDRVKKTLTDTLQKQGMNKIGSLVPTGYRMIDGTQQFKETDSSSDPKVGEKVSDSGNFSVSLKGEVTALAVSEDDLQQAIGILITNNQKVGSDFQINGVSDAVIGDVTRTNDTATFTVSSSGNLQSAVTADQLKQNLAGKTLEQAEDYLSHVTEIVSHKITYSPGIVPDFLKRIPSDLNRIKIVF